LKDLTTPPLITAVITGWRYQVFAIPVLEAITTLEEFKKG